MRRKKGKKKRRREREGDRSGGPQGTGHVHSVATPPPSHSSLSSPAASLLQKGPLIPWDCGRGFQSGPQGKSENFFFCCCFTMYPFIYI